MDTYTKTVLTVIAICLVFICLRDVSFVTEAHADELNLSTSPQYGLVPLNEDGSITVKLDNTETIDVSIRGINTYDKLKVDLVDINTSDKLNINIAEIKTTDELDVNIDEVGGYSTYGKVKVDVVE